MKWSNRYFHKEIMAILLTIALAILVSCSYKKEIYEVTDYKSLIKQKQPVVSEQVRKEEEVIFENVWDKWDYPYETVNLVWYIIGVDAPPDELIVEKEINKYLKGKINATVDLKFYNYDESYFLPLTKALKSGEQIDIFFTAGWLRADLTYFALAKQGALYPLNDYYTQGGYLEETRKILGDSFLNGSKVDGINYGVPCNKEKAFHRGILLRADIVEELSIDINSVWSLTDMEPYFEQVTIKYPEVYPFVAEAPIELLMWNHILNKSVPLVLYGDNRDNTIVNMFEMPETIAYLNLMRSYYLKGYVHHAELWAEELRNGTLFSIQQSLKPGKDREISATSKADYIQVDMTQPVISNNEAIGSIMTIYHDSPNPERAAMLLEIANTDKYFNNLLNYGIEGYHFEKVDNNVIKFTNKREYYNLNIGWVLPNQLMNYVIAGEYVDKFRHFEHYNTIATPLNNLGFIFDTTGFEEIIEDITTIVDDIQAENFHTGALVVDPALNQLLKDLEDAGLEDLKNEMQRQYDKWLAKNN